MTRTDLHELHADVVPRAFAAAEIGRVGVDELREVFDGGGENLGGDEAGLKGGCGGEFEGRLGLKRVAAAWSYFGVARFAVGDDGNRQGLETCRK